MTTGAPVQRSSRDRHLLRRAAGLALIATFGLSACGGGDDEAAADAAPTTSATSPTATGNGSATTSPSASSSASTGTSTGTGTGAAPATGKVVDTSYFTARAPEHYRVRVMGKDFSIAASGPGGQLGFSIIDLHGDRPTLEQLARETRHYAFGLEHAPVGGTTTLGGDPAFSMFASSAGHNVSDVGLEHDGFLITLQVDTWGTTRAQHLRLQDSVLATWQWK